MMLPLALTMGEPAGIGGEITLMAWQRRAEGPYYASEALRPRSRPPTRENRRCARRSSCVLAARRKCLDSRWECREVMTEAPVKLGYLL